MPYALRKRSTAETTTEARTAKDGYSFDNIPSGLRRRNSNSSRRSQMSPPPPMTTEALSMTFLNALSGLHCTDCGKDHSLLSSEQEDTSKSLASQRSGDLDTLQALMELPSQNHSISPLVEAPMTPGDTAIPSSMASKSFLRTYAPNDTTTIESLLAEYMALCQVYKVPYNSGIVTTIRFSLPSLKVTGSFHDMDLLVLVELLLRHANTTLAFLRRLDFSMASKEGKQFKSYKLGFSSHGAFALAKALQGTRYISEVWMPRHRIGSYGASALFLACRDNPTIHVLNLRRCRIGERGAFALADILNASGTGLVDVDMSANGIGHRGTVALNRAVERRNASSPNPPVFVNLEGNLVFPEIMNGITHGLGILLSIIGGYLLSSRVQDLSWTHTISCAVYTTSLLTLYTSSTLFHSFFILRNTRYIFQVMDKCAIYVLIAGSYTPFLTILFGDKPVFSVWLLGFIWTCGLLGILVEAFAPTWDYRKFFSLCMYLGMGWASVVCLPEIRRRIDPQSTNLMVIGGVAYTVGVPFFVRNNNLDHAIWHVFVLSGSIFHWMAVYFYVAPLPLSA